MADDRALERGRIRLNTNAVTRSDGPQHGFGYLLQHRTNGHYMLRCRKHHWQRAGPIFEVVDQIQTNGVSSDMPTGAPMK